MKKTIIWISLILIVASFISCGGGSGGGNSSQADDGSYAVIPDTTKVLDATTIQNLESASSDYSTLTFSGWTNLLKQIDDNDVIIAGVNGNIPNGMLRKVSSVYEDSGKVIVETEQAALSEAVQEGKILMTKVLESGELDKSNTMNGVSIVKSCRNIKSKGLNIELVDVEIAPGVYANGEISFDIGLNFELDLDWFNVEYFEFTTNTEFDSSLEFSSTTSATIDEMVEVGRITFVPFDIQVGPVPVTFSPVLSLNVGIDGEVSANLIAEAQQTATLKTGVTYDDSWHEVKDFTSDFDFTTPTINANARVKGYLGPQFSILLYGVAGPYANLYGYIELESNLVNAEAWWSLYAGMELAVGIKVEALGINLANYEIAKLIDYRKQLASGHGSQNLNWSVETIASVPYFSSGESSHYFDIAIDSNNRPHICFFEEFITTDEYGDEIGYTELKYAHWNGAMWIVETLARSGSSYLNFTDFYSSIALDTQDRVHVVFPCSSPDDQNIYRDQLRYMYWNGNTWSTEIIDTDVEQHFESRNLHIKIGTDGIPQVVYYKVLPDVNEVKYAVRNGTWTTSTVDTEGSVYYLDMTLDSLNKPHVVYKLDNYDLDYEYLRYANFDGSSWAKSNIISYEITSFLYRNIGNTSISTDSGNKPHVADTGKCMYSYYTGSSWTGFETFDEDTSNELNYQGKILINPANEPMIVYEYYDNDNSMLKFAYQTTEGWIKEQIDVSDNWGLGTNISAVKDNTGKVHVVYLDYGNQAVKYAKQIWQ